MSAKRMAASTPRTSAAKMVVSAASSGFLHSSRKDTLDRSERYSAMYRPACRISQTGVASTGSRRQARRNRLFHRASVVVG